MKIIKYIIVILFILFVLIYALLVFLEPKKIILKDITPLNKQYVDTKIIFIDDDKNITISDKYNTIKFIMTSNIKKVKVEIKNNHRFIVVKKQPTKFITTKDSMWISNQHYKHLGGYMGIEIHDIDIDKFYVNFDGEFHAKWKKQ
jgi:hypothetical protein